jgi:rod shape-determining protein MreD
LLLATQIIIFNNIEFLGLYKSVSLYFIYHLFPVNGNKQLLIVTSFFLGIIMDIFSNSGGVHAAACLILAYARPYIFKFSFGLSYEYQTIKINDSLTPERFSFLLLSVVIHHFILFILEVFHLSFFDILFRTIIGTLFTLLICIILIYLFKPSKR